MLWSTTVGVLFLILAVSAIPVPSESEVEVINENTTLSTELKPPPVPEESNKKAVLFLINLFAVKNISEKAGEEETEVLQDDLMKDVPGLSEPFATILLVVEEDNEEIPVKLDEIAKDLEEEGFTVEKIEKDGETKVIKVNIEIPEEDLEGAEESKEEQIIKLPRMTKIRKKRTICLKCKLDEMRARKYAYGGGGYGGGGHGGGGYGGGGYGGGHGHGGCNGGCGGEVPVVVVPVQQRPQYRPQPVYQPQHHHQQPVYRPSPNQCNVCGGNHGGQSHASAHAEAHASSSSW